MRREITLCCKLLKAQGTNRGWVHEPVAEIVPNTADRDQLTAIIDKWEKAWNSHDMRAAAAGS